MASERKTWRNLQLTISHLAALIFRWGSTPISTHLTARPPFDVLVDLRLQSGTEMVRIVGERTHHLRREVADLLTIDRGGSSSRCKFCVHIIDTHDVVPVAVWTLTLSAFFSQ